MLSGKEHFPTDPRGMEWKVLKEWGCFHQHWVSPPLLVLVPSSSQDVTGRTGRSKAPGMLQRSPSRRLPLLLPNPGSAEPGASSFVSVEELNLKNSVNLIRHCNHRKPRTAPASASQEEMLGKRTHPPGARQSLPLPASPGCSGFWLIHGDFFYGSESRSLPAPGGETWLGGEVM